MNFLSLNSSSYAFYYSSCYLLTSWIYAWIFLFMITSIVKSFRLSFPFFFSWVGCEDNKYYKSAYRHQSGIFCLSKFDLKTWCFSPLNLKLISYSLSALIQAQQSQFESNYQGILIFIEQNNPFREKKHRWGIIWSFERTEWGRGCILLAERIMDNISCCILDTHQNNYIFFGISINFYSIFSLDLILMNILMDMLEMRLKLDEFLQCNEFHKSQTPILC